MQLDRKRTRHFARAILPSSPIHLGLESWGQHLPLVCNSVKACRRFGLSRPSGTRRGEESGALQDDHRIVSAKRKRVRHHVR